eukprot:COSAG06_NODE_1909_length_8084_cov_66.552536_12_plen_85_part_00
MVICQDEARFKSDGFVSPVVLQEDLDLRYFEAVALVAVHEAGLRGEHRLHPARLDQPERLLPARLCVRIIDSESQKIIPNSCSS